MRPGRSFRMILHAKNRLRLMPHAFHRLIVEIDPIHLHVARQRLGIDREPMILRRDFNLAGFQIFHRLIAAAMTELELKGFSAKGLPRIWCPRQIPKIGTPLLTRSLTSLTA